MKPIMLYAVSAFFFLGTSFAHEVAVNPVVITHKAIVEYRVVQLNNKLGTLCSTNYITTTTDGKKSATRKSADCEE
jgi:hypothetical protein